MFGKSFFDIFALKFNLTRYWHWFSFVLPTTIRSIGLHRVSWYTSFNHPPKLDNKITEWNTTSHWIRRNSVNVVQCLVLNCFRSISSVSFWWMCQCEENYAYSTATEIWLNVKNPLAAKSKLFLFNSQCE